MNRKILIAGIGGLLLGCVVGFVFANYLNRNANVSSALTANADAAPPALNTGATPMLEVQTVIEKAAAEPDNFEAQTQAAAMFYQIQRFDEAIKFLKKANQLKPDDYGTIVNLGNSYFDSNQFEEAEKWYAAALVKNAADANVRTDFGLTFLLRQPPDYDRAAREFALALKKEPNHPQALQNMTVAYTKKEDAARAKETLVRLEKLDAANPALAKLREDIQKLESK